MSDTSTRRLLPDLRSFGPSVIRTVVPLIVSVVIGWPVAEQLGISEGQATVAATAVVGGLYWLIVRLIEQYVQPNAGWLLGYASAPVYVAAKDAGASPTPVTDVIKVVTEHNEGH